MTPKFTPRVVCLPVCLSARQTQLRQADEEAVIKSFTGGSSRDAEESRTFPLDVTSCQARLFPVAFTEFEFYFWRLEIICCHCLCSGQPPSPPKPPNPPYLCCLVSVVALAGRTLFLKPSQSVLTRIEGASHLLSEAEFIAAFFLPVP